MVAKEEQRERVVTLLSASLLKTGLSQTSLRQLAKAAGVSDRMLLYYFKDKPDIILTVISQIASEMSDLLVSAIPENPKLAPPDLITRALLVTQGDAMKPYMQLWIEIVAAASRGEQPYAMVASQIALGFIQWIENHLEGEANENKRAISAMIFTMIDGLALLDICAGEEQSRLAVKAIQQIAFTTKPTA
jgi:AcrR family transcriptional regulator